MTNKFDGKYKIKGYKNDVNRMELFKLTDLQINITADETGATLSVGDLEEGIQYCMAIDKLISDFIEFLEERK